MDYERRSHAKHCLMCHLIFVCKYRHRVLSLLGNEIKALMHEIADENSFSILEVETDNDHIHLLVRYSPAQSILQLVRLLKQISTYRIWRQNGNAKILRRYFWKENTLWSRGYFACSVGQASKDTIEKYIQSQG